MGSIGLVGRLFCDYLYCMANDDFYPSFWCKMNLCIDLIFVIFDNLKIWRDDWRTDAVNYGYKTDRDISRPLSYILQYSTYKIHHDIVTYLLQPILSKYHYGSP